ncbi:crotonase/enoyl-CoA hydratase family protein [Paraburkholderia sp. C35]|uniref:crotonase/enoyl-CoA hydratase family protein n=1 Tax=Paraburkholderia sp. C35 TaxID=2126993 RepID=UPI000D69A152|nr:crotonase/enoyl-CoA hydratase family protein [Paraburkholderia sp. C35]
MSNNEAGKVTMRSEGHICVITVENEAKKNSYTPAMMDQLAEHLTAYEENADLWVAILCSAGEHTTAGLDLPRFFGPEAEPNRRKPGLVDPFGLERRCTKPVIAVVQGITFTVGIEMMLASDIVVAADTARFQQLEARRGIAPLGGAHFRYLSRTGWGNAMYHLFMCEEFDAARALQLGFVQEVHPFGRHMERAMEIAKIICKNAPIGIQATKVAALKYIEAAEKTAVASIPEIEKKVFSTEDFKEGIASFKERREAKFIGR